MFKLIEQAHAAPVTQPSGNWNFLTPTFSFPDNITATDLMNSIITWIGLAATLIAVLYLIWNGIQYITAGGDEEKQTVAKRGITGSVIGIIVILLAYVIVRVVTNTISPYNTGM